MTTVVVGMAALAAGIAFLWVPHVEQKRDRTWAAAGKRAISAVRLPARFRPYERIPIGSNGVLACGIPACFAAPDDPRDNVDDVRDALAAIATGPVSATCGPDGGFASSPDKCRVVAPVDGSRVDVWIFAKFVHRGHRPVDAGDFNGTLVQMVVAPRQ